MPSAGTASSRSVRTEARSRTDDLDDLNEGGRHKSPVLVVIMMIITVIVDLDDLDDLDEGGRHKSTVLVVIMMNITAIVDLDDLDYVDDNPEYLTRTKRRGLLLAAATQARRESRRQIQQPEVQRESQV